MNTYNYEIVKLTCQDGLEVSNYVYSVEFHYTVTDGSESLTQTRTVRFPFDADRTDYVNYSDLTAETVWSWVEDLDEGEYINNLNLIVDNALSVKTTPKVAYTTPELPW